VHAPHRRESALRLVRGDDQDFSLDALYRRYCRYVAAVILRLNGRETEVEDIVQDVFVEATRGIQRLKEPDAVKGWLATITVRVVRRRLRLRRLRRVLGFDEQVDYARLADRGASPVDKLLVKAVYQMLDEMPVEDRLAFTLHHVEGETIDAVAVMCGCSCATAKRRIARAQRAIEKGFAHG
jgi:RNA polymerase sigma-70 factor, ECF subfamily